MGETGCFFQRHDSPEKGRHLVAAQAIGKGTLLWAERPLACLPSIRQGNISQHHWLCHHCKAAVGGPDNAIRRRFGNEVVEDIEYRVISCRQNCGQVYCSAECEAIAWAAQHYLLCTGLVGSINHPLVRFKQISVESNEILLLVAEWWVSEHVRRHSVSSTHSSQTDPYRDFCNNFWWDVVANGMTEDETTSVKQSLRSLCQDASELLSASLADLQSDDNAIVPPITAENVARIVGAFEQNAMGIRSRHPVTRDIFDRSYREKHHTQIVKCLAEAGFIGDDYDEEDLSTNSGEPSSLPTRPKEVRWNFSVDEIAEFLSNLHIDEEGTVRDLADEHDEEERSNLGDDLDLIFPPLDGTAMYATACKMNHSCEPNVICLYKPRRWGQCHPLVVFVVARRDIVVGEELTISYVEERDSLEERQQNLQNYGFICQCIKCTREMASSDTKPATDKTLSPFDCFGDDNEGDDEEQCKEEADEESPDTDINCDSSISEGALQACLGRLEAKNNHSNHGTVPLPLVAQISSFLIQTASDIKFSTNISLDDTVITGLVRSCSSGSQDRDFCLLKTVGSDLESVLFAELQKRGTWESSSHRLSYWCSTVAAAVGYANECHFLEAIGVLDKGLMTGLPRDDPRIRDFFSYVEQHATEMTAIAVSLPSNCTVPDFQDEFTAQQIINTGLPYPIRFPLAKTWQEIPTISQFQEEYIAASQPLLVHRFAKDWPALASWRRVDSFFGRPPFGHRLVPIETGSMMNEDSGMAESLVTLREFVSVFLVPSTRHGLWHLSEAASGATTPSVAYIAQHPLLDQIPALKRYLDPSPVLCGKDGPTHINVWMGTGGTRTPLHYDSYDNLLVQLVGVKYVRLYDSSQTPLLYVDNKASYRKQGNMSAINCEMEDYDKHPNAQSAAYTEVVLYPGDCLYIPWRTWHYVRSLTTSISVNYWF